MIRFWSKQLSLLLVLGMQFYTTALHSAQIEIQSSPSSSFRIRPHPVRSDLFANVEFRGETTLWQIVSGTSVVKVLTLGELVASIDLINAPEATFETKISIGTHYGELKIFDGSGHLNCVGKNASGADIVYLSYIADKKKILTVDRLGSVDAWDDECRPIKAGIEKHNSAPTGLVLLRDHSKAIASWRDGTLGGIDLASFTSLGAIAFPAPSASIFSGIQAITLSHDDLRLGVAVDNRIAIFSLTDLVSQFGKGRVPEPSAELDNGYNTINEGALAFVPGDQFLIFADLNGYISLWSGHNGEAKRPLAKDASDSVAAFPDGVTVATGSRDHPPRLWRFGPLSGEFSQTTSICR
jgi:WD40 repeat protein